MPYANKTKRWLSFFFSSYVWLGVVLILLSIVVDEQLQITSLWFTSITSLVQSIGIAIMVASIFTYASGTSEFVNKIQDLLQDIVVSRNFLGNIDSDSKKEALSALIKPSTEEKRIYSNIEDYLNTYISKTMEVTSKCVRSNYSVNARAFVDRTSGRVVCASVITYRLYPTKDGFSDIKVGFFEKEKDSTCTRVIVNTPHGEREPHEDLSYEEVALDGGRARLATIDLSKHEKNCAHLDIEVEMLEPGSDHWKMLSFSALQPTDGFRHHVRCEDGLEIRDYHTFVHGARMHIDPQGKNELTVSCNEWVNEGTGLSILISLPDAHAAPEHVQRKPSTDAQES